MFKGNQTNLANQNLPLGHYVNAMIGLTLVVMNGLIVFLVSLMMSHHQLEILTKEILTKEILTLLAGVMLLPILTNLRDVLHM